MCWDIGISIASKRTELEYKKKYICWKHSYNSAFKNNLQYKNIKWCTSSAFKRYYITEQMNFIVSAIQIIQSSTSILKLQFKSYENQIQRNKKTNIGITPKQLSFCSLNPPTFWPRRHSLYIPLQR